MPSGLRLQLARQALDEAQHAEMFIIRLREFGGEIGDYPITLRSRIRLLLARRSTVASWPVNAWAKAPCWTPSSTRSPTFAERVMTAQPSSWSTWLVKFATGSLR